MAKLSNNALHLLRLTEKGADADGWSKVSKVVWPLLEVVPDDLAEKRPSDDGGFIRLTSDGRAIVRYS